MSLVRLALRVATVRALQGATWAEGRVFDSAISPIDQTITEERQPVIIVATDSEKQTITGKSWLSAQREIELVIETAVASQVVTNDTASLVIPQTDAGLEQTLDCMGRQIQRALAATDTPWARVWRGLVWSLKTVHVRRGASAEKGVSFAAHQYALTCETIAEPPFGAPVAPGSPWADLLAAMRADDELGDLADILETEIANPTLDGWQAAAAALGVNRSLAPMLRLAADTPEDCLADASTDTVEWDGTVSSDEDA